MTATAATPEPVQAEEQEQSQKLDDMIDLLYQLVQDKKGLDKESKQIGELIRNQQNAIANLMEEVGTSIARGAVATVTISEDTVPTIKDWESTLRWIEENDCRHLLQRRITAAAYKELLAAGEEVEGLEPTTLTKVNCRKI